MIRRLVLVASIVLLAGSPPVFSGQDTHSGQAVRESGQASVHASASAAHALVASGQVTSAVSAVPLAIGGAALTSAGTASTGAAKSLQKAASAPAGTPLKITDESLVTVPPDEALKP